MAYFEMQLGSFRPHTFRPGLITKKKESTQTRLYNLHPVLPVLPFFLLSLNVISLKYSHRALA